MRRFRDRAPIQVGVDGTPADAAAVEWAAHEAALLRRRLRLVYTIEQPGLRARRERGRSAETLETGAGPGVLAAAEARVRELEPGVRIRTEISRWPLPEALVKGSGLAYETVVAKHDDQDATGPSMLSSAALRVVALAHGRVVVVPAHPHDGTGEIVAAVDGSSLDGSIAEYAFAQAEHRHATLRLLHAWQSPNSPVRNHYVIDPYAADLRAREVVGELIDRIGPRFPGVKVIPEVLHEHPVRAIDGAALQAALVVVGARGRTGATRFFLGSVSTAVLNHAPCPVAIIPSSLGMASA